jgi:hypothetical protein
MLAGWNYFTKVQTQPSSPGTACMSVQYSLAAMIMHGRPKATVTRKERNQIDARVKAVYRTAFQIYSDNLPLKILKTTLRSSSVVTEAGINSKKK